MKRIFYILLILFSYATPSFSEITEVYGNFLNPSERKCLKIILNEPKTDPDNEYTSVYDPEQEPSIADIYIKDKKIFSVMGEYLYYAGLCFDQHTKLHNLIFKIPKIYENELVDIIYVHYEKDSNSFSKTILDYQFDDYSQLDETVKTKAQPTCSWRAILDAKNKARKVKNQILPSEKVSNFKKEIKKNKKYVRFTLATKIVHDKVIESLVQDKNFSTKTILKNNKWTVKVIKNEDGVGSDNWGVLVAKQKGKDFWTSFYNIPTGWSKVLIYEPLNIDSKLETANLNDLMKKRPSLKKDDILTAYFCIDSVGWGALDIFNIDLSSWDVYYLNQNNRQPFLGAYSGW